jgi:glycosyltransferase involved in cell wall biosynthesis
MSASLSATHQAWLDAFVAAHGRAPRVLHVGNVANNAFNNAKVLNGVGIESDVVCYDYYHIMGCPEWEEAEFDVRCIDQMKPRWYQVDLKGYQRPPWFAQGPMPLCIEYLAARRSGEADKASELWHELLVASGVMPPPSASAPAALPIDPAEAPVVTAGVTPQQAADLDRLDGLGLPPPVLRLARIGRSVFLAPPGVTWARVVRMVNRIGHRFLPSVFPGAQAAAMPTVMEVQEAPQVAATTSIERPVDPRFQALIAAFKSHFPNRTDALTAEDLVPYGSCRAEWQALCAHYDLVIGYSTDGIYPLIADKRPYIAFEHGTIRDIPFESTSQGRVAALTYAECDAIFMTNADSLPQARRLNGNRIIKGLHGFNWPNMQRRMGQVKPADLQALYGLPGGLKTFLGPARQHWKDGPSSWHKGNDRIVRSAKALTADHEGKFKVILVAWGAEVEATRQLVAELGVEDHILWIDPVPKAELWALYMAVDCVLDQFVLTCIGGVTMEAIALGSPIITALDEATMAEFYGESIPLLNGQTIEQITAAMAEVIEGTPRARAAGQRSREWFHSYHTGDVVMAKLLEAITGVLPLPPAQDASLQGGRPLHVQRPPMGMAA